MKQTIEIEVPEGKKAIWEDGQIRFISIESWRDITTFEKALKYLERNHLRSDLVRNYYDSNLKSYANSVTRYQIIVAAGAQRNTEASYKFSPRTRRILVVFTTLDVGRM